MHVEHDRHKKEKQTWILTLAALCFYYSGLVWLAHKWRQTQVPRLAILNYHRASGGDLRHHMLYLRRNYHVLPLEIALKELYAPSKNALAKKDRRTRLVLTFDDGYYDNYTHAFKLACELQIPITIFLVPGYIESGSRFWWLEAQHLVAHAQVDEVAIEGHTYHLDKCSEQEALIMAIDGRLRHASAVTEREAILAFLHNALAVPSTMISKKGESDVLPLTWTEVREMDQSGWITFGAHTVNHPVLKYLADPTEVLYEVSESRKLLEKQLGHPVLTFAYPVGLSQHIGEDGLRAVEIAGFNRALTTMFGFNTSQSNPLLLRRIVVDVDQHWTMIAAKASGVWGFFSRLCWKFLTLFWKDKLKEHYSW